MPKNGPTDRASRSELSSPRTKLSDFVLRRAHQTAAEVGFGWRAQAVAPSTYDDLKTAYEISSATGRPLPVANQHCDNTIYTSAGVNAALRFWHDVNHVRRGLTFDLVDELELSLHLLGELETAGYPRYGVVWQLLHADMTGPAYVQSFAGRFPLDQWRFVTGCVQSGFDHGLVAELRAES